MKKKIVLTCLSLLSSFGISRYMQIGQNSTGYVTNTALFSLILLGISYYLLHKINFNDKRNMLLSSIVGTLFSIMSVTGKNLLVLNASYINHIGTWINIIGLSILFSSMINLLYAKLSTIVFKNNTVVNSKFLFWAKYDKIIVFFLLIISWMPILLATYPGIFGYDSIFQMDYYLNNSIYLHHPLIHTYLMGIVIYTIGNLLGSLELGLLLYSIIQMIIVSLSITRIYSLLKKIQTPRIIQFGMIIFFMVIPTNAIMSLSVTKDIIFSAIFVAFTCNIAEISMRIRSIDTKWLISTIGYTFLMSAFRNQGIYIFYATFIVLLITFRKFYKQILLYGVSVIALFTIYSGPVTNMLNGVPTNSIKEMLSVPTIQLARVYTHVDNLSDHLKDEIKLFVPDAPSYDEMPGLADRYKGSFNEELFKQDKSRFVKLYLGLLKKYPTVYFDAWARLSIGLWYPDVAYKDENAFHPYFEYEGTSFYAIEPDRWVYIPHYALNGFSTLRNELVSFAHNRDRLSIPIVSTVLSSGLLLWHIIFTSGYVIYKKKYILLVPLATMIFLWGTLMLGPVVMYRYIYPLVLTNFILFGLYPMSNIQGGRKDEKNSSINSMF